MPLPIVRPHAPSRRRAVAPVAACLAASLGHAVPAGADVWVFAPSVALDQRFDDNYSLDVFDPDGVSATRAVGELGLSRESPTFSLKGLLRADVLLTAGAGGNGDDGTDLDSNQIAGIETRFGDRLTRYGVDFGFKQDTPSRDIAGDLTVGESVATDTGSIDQESNVSRRRFTIAPSVVRELGRRTSVEGRVTYTNVQHDRENARDLVLQQYNGLLANLDALPPERQALLVDADGNRLPNDEVTIDTVGPFTPSGELEDFEEVKLDVGFRYKLSPITTLSIFAATSRYAADAEPDALAFVPDEAFEEDPDVRGIRRVPRRETISTTSSLRVGYDRALSQTLGIGVEGGFYVNRTDDNDTLRASDLAPPEVDLGADYETQFAERLGTLDTSDNGWLANVTLRKDAGLTRYVGRFAVDVQPSSVGSQVETRELTGEAIRSIDPLIDVSLRARAYEPDRLGANADDEFSRRFISIEPRVTWRFARAWTADASYRYRRQKSRAVADSAESNAVLFSIRWTPPSQVRDLAGG